MSAGRPATGAASSIQLERDLILPLSSGKSFTAAVLLLLPFFNTGCINVVHLTP